MFDAAGAITVGAGLIGLSVFLGKRNIQLLNGHSIPPKLMALLRYKFECAPVVGSVYNLKADYMGPGNISVRADLDFDGRIVTRCSSRLLACSSRLLAYQTSTLSPGAFWTSRTRSRTSCSGSRALCWRSRGTRRSRWEVKICAPVGARVGAPVGAPAAALVAARVAAPDNDIHI